MLDLLRVISHHRARLATPIRRVQKIFSDADLENIPYADSMYNRGGVATNRPLLIEPSYKVNEDKTKSQTRSSRSSGEQDGKTTPRPTPDNKADSKVAVTPKSDSKADKSNSKVDAKVAEKPNLDTREDQNGTAATMSDPNVGDKATVKSTSKSVPKTNSKVAEMSGSESKVAGSVSDNSSKGKKMPESKQPKFTSNGNVTQNCKFDNPSLSSSEIITDKEGRLKESKQEGDKAPVPQPPTSRPALEENIVLGVALEGSKRTLPIEEDMASPQPPEVKGLASACRSGNGSTTDEKERKEGQTPSPPSATCGVNEIS